MTAPRLPEVEALVDGVTEGIKGEAASDAVWHVEGPPTAGKSVLLGMLADRLSESGLAAITAAPAAQSLDAGPSAITELAAGLKIAGMVNGETSVLRDSSRPLVAKLADISRWIEQRKDDVVVLIDDPLAWPARSDQSGYFAEHARLVVHELLHDLNCRRVVVGDMPDSVRPIKRLRIGPHSDARRFLDNAAWGPLADPACELLLLKGDDLNRFSPLELRLLVAHTTIDSVQSVSRMLASAVSRRALSRELARRLASSDDHAELLRAWKRLANIRRPFSEDLLVQMAGRLDDINDALLRHCLLYPTRDGWTLHETLRRDVAPHTDDDDQFYDRLRTLAVYYRDTSHAASVADDPALVPAMESFYYAARAGARDLLADEPFFVDQLDLLGKTLSYERRDYESACEVFRQAIAIDGTDDYAQHYLAYNLDRLGWDAEEVELHYRKAIQLNGRHPWWRARLISFLVIQGRTSEAELEWDGALDDVAAPDASGGIAIYETLHGWVAGTLLRRGQLDFAERVLSDVPLEARKQSPSLTALIRRLRALQLAERDGAFVPGQHLRDHWWTDGPFLLQQRVGGDDQLRLRRWLAGRIENLDANTVELRVKDIEIGAEAEPPTATTRIERALFDQLNRDAEERARRGAFVEVGLYSSPAGDEPTRIVRVHRQEEWDDEALPLPTGRGDRYWSVQDR